MKKILKGVVVSNKMEGTAVVRIERRIFHERYKKFIVKTKRLAVDISGLKVSLGDNVCIERAKRMSKTKSWRLVNVLTGIEGVSLTKKWDPL